MNPAFNDFSVQALPHSRGTLVMVVVAHVAAALLIVQLFEARRYVEPMPLLVSLLSPPLQAQAPPEPVRTVPEPLRKMQPEPLPIPEPVQQVRQEPKPVERVIVPEAVPPEPAPEQKMPEPAPPEPVPQEIVEPTPPPRAITEVPVPPPPPIPEPVIAAVPEPQPVTVPRPPPRAITEVPVPPSPPIPEPVVAAVPEPQPVTVPQPPPVATKVPAPPPDPLPIAAAEPAPEKIISAPVPVQAVQPPAEVTMTPEMLTVAYLSNPKPGYPNLSRRLREQGMVLLRVFVTVAGEPTKVELKSSSGFPRLDRAAHDAVKRWKFVPARRDDQPVDAWVIVPIKFSLKG